MRICLVFSLSVGPLDKHSEGGQAENSFISKFSPDNEKGARIGQRELKSSYSCVSCRKGTAG